VAVARGVSRLDRLLSPETVAVVGASATPGKWGHSMLKTLLDGGFAGEVAAVTLRGGEVLGRPAYPSVADLPWAPDVALVTLAREQAVVAVEALAARGCRHAVVHAAGFRESGPEGAALETRMVAAARARGMRLVGPNCMSLMVARSRLNLTGIPDLRPGRLAFVSQSGNLVYDLAERGRVSGLGLSVFVSVGNQADLGIEDFLEAVAEDAATGAVALYVEAIRPGRGRLFLERARRLAGRKPVVALVGGRSAPGRQAALSHTASLLTDLRLLRGLLRQAGVTEVERLDELFPVAEALLHAPPPPRRTVALCGGGGGHATVGSDALTRHDVALPEPGPETQAALRALFPPMASVRNPVDWTGASERSFWVYRDAARLLLADPRIGGVILFGHFGAYLAERETPADNYRDVAAALGALQRETGKPVLVHSIYAGQSRPAFDALRDAGVALFGSLETAAAAFRALAEHGCARRRGPLPAPAPRDDLLAPFARRARAEGRPALLLPEAFEWLAALGLPVLPHRWVRSAGEAEAAAEALAGPVALKLVSPTVLHKTEAGGVHLDLRGPAAVRAAFEAVRAAAADRAADFRGALVVPMAGPGVDVAVGIASSELGGHGLLFGAGGTAIEALQDVAARPAPLDGEDAASMVGETVAGRLLAAPRGLAPPPLAPLTALMVRLSAAVAGSIAIEAVDLNPVRVGPGGVAILDARVILTPASEGA
jgi:acyl-CoA synthetase (NDP forming)